MISPVPSNGAEGFIFSIALCRRSRGVCFVTRLLRYCGFAGAIWLQRFLPRSMPSTTILMAPLLLVRGIRTGSLLVPLRGGGPSHKLHPPWVAAMTESEHDPGQ